MQQKNIENLSLFFMLHMISSSVIARINYPKVTAIRPRYKNIFYIISLMGSLHASPLGFEVLKFSFLFEEWG